MHWIVTSLVLLYAPALCLAQSLPSPQVAIPTLPTQATPKGYVDGLLAMQSVTIKMTGAKCDGVTDDTTALNALLAANRTVTIPAGTGVCRTSAALNVTLDNTVLAGAGYNSATFQSTSATDPVFRVGPGTSHVTLRGFSVDRTATPGATAHGIDITAGGIFAVVADIKATNHYYGFALGGIAYGQAISNIAQNNYSDGFHLSANASAPNSQWTLDRNLSQANDGWGYNAASSGSTPMILLPWMNVTSFANTLGGAALHGTAAAPIYDVTITSSLFSTDNGPALLFDTYGGQHKVGAGTFMELAGTGVSGRNLATPATHAGQGLYITGANGDILVNGNYISANSQDGAVCGAFRCTFVGNVSTQNGQAMANTYSGMSFLNSIPGSTMLAVGNRSGNLNTSTPQATGISVLNGVGTTISGNDLQFNGTAGLAVGSNATAMSAHGNIGFDLESSGVSNIAVGNLSVSVVHGLAVPPTQMLVFPNTDPGTGRMWADGCNATTCTVHTSATFTSLIGFSWQARVFNR